MGDNRWPPSSPPIVGGLLGRRARGRRPARGGVVVPTPGGAGGSRAADGQRPLTATPALRGRPRAGAAAPPRLGGLRAGRRRSRPSAPPPPDGDRGRGRCGRAGSPLDGSGAAR